MVQTKLSLQFSLFPSLDLACSFYFPSYSLPSLFSVTRTWDLLSSGKVRDGATFNLSLIFSTRTFYSEVFGDDELSLFRVH